jgi:hypothetical protein
VHFVEHLANGEFWNIDTSAELFQRELKEILPTLFAGQQLVSGKLQEQ